MLKAPNDSQHLAVIGRNGSGKTQAAVFHLSYRSWDTKPWVIFDTKGDELIEKIGKIDGVRHIGLGEQPAKRGLHIVRPLPNQETETDAFLWRIHARNNVGLYFDEGYMIGKSDALNALLTQGRSKRIPIIILSQRPAFLSRFVFTEASYYQVFQLVDRRDRKTVQEFIPRERVDVDRPLQAYHSIWYDVKQDRAFEFSPVPPSETILSTYRTRLQPRRIAI